MTTPLEPLYTFKEQTSFSPNIEFEASLPTKEKTVVVGMGGSATGALLLMTMFPSLPLTLHNSYGLPEDIDISNTLVILNSYSGETEEVLDAFDRCIREGVAMAVVSKGGTLREEAVDRNIPHITLPDTNLEPRFALVHQMIAILTLMGEHSKVQELENAVSALNSTACETKGKILADLYNKKYIVLYTTKALYAVAQGIKASLTEGPKVPAFVSIIPEANHNELHGFVRDGEHDEHEHFGFLLLSSTYDHQRIQKRYTVMEELYKEKSFRVATITTDHTNPKQILETLLTGYFMATYLALNNQVEPYKTPFIQLFKKKMIEP